MPCSFINRYAIYLGELSKLALSTFFWPAIITLTWKVASHSVGLQGDGARSGDLRGFFAEGVGSGLLSLFLSELGLNVYSLGFLENSTSSWGRSILFFLLNFGPSLYS